MRETPRIVRSADARRSPWRNGGGVTVEMAAHPRGASVDAFGWRVSLATISADGPFSAFAGVDRTLVVLDGGGLVLEVGEDGPRRLRAMAAPYDFPGDAPCEARLLDGPTSALNVMVARGGFDRSVTLVAPETDPPFRPDATTVLVCSRGAVETGLGLLGPRDALIVPAGAQVEVGRLPPSTQAVAASLWRLGA